MIQNGSSLINDGGLKVENALRFLTFVEAEIVWLSFEKGKTKREIAQILKIPDSTASYRYKRAIEKICYLELLCSIDIVKIVSQFGILNDREQKILVDLFYTANQHTVARKHGCNQSSVRWVFIKTRKHIYKAEEEDPSRWFDHLGLFMYLEKNLLLRVV